MSKVNWNQKSNQAWKSAWKSDNIGGSLGAITSGITGVVSAGVNNAQIKDTSAEEAMIEDVANTQFSTGSFDNLMSEFNSNAMARNNFTRQEVRGVSDGQMFGNTLSGIASGAISGAQIGGPWGAVAGAVIGLGSGIAGIAIGNKKAREKARELNNNAQLANSSYLNSFSNSVENTQNTMFNNSLLNVASYGGPLFNHSGDWTNGLTFINAGGTHEQNPFEGVQVGIDPQGIPNLVEEGEIIYNDYVFSNRLKPTKKQLEDSGLNKKYKGWTFAKIVEDLQKESADSPIDFISQNTLEDMISIVTKMQEEIRMKKNKTNNKFDVGGLKDSYVEEGLKDNWKYDFLRKYGRGPKYATLGPNGKALFSNLNLSGMGIEYTNLNIPEYVDVVEDSVNEASLPTIFANDVVNNVIAKSKQPAQFTSLRTDLDNELAITPIKPVTGKATSNIKTGKPVNTNLASSVVDASTGDKGFNWQSLGRYAPVLADATTLMTNLFTKPDYSNAEAGVKAMRDVPMVDVTPIGNYLQLDNLDRNYYLNPLLASSRSTARAIQNQGLNAGQTQFALLANQHELNKATGNALMEMERENMARDLQEAQFNLGIDQYNANQAMQARQMNQQRAYNIAQAEANAAQMREAIDAQRTAAISQGLSGLSEGLAGIGTESVYRDWLGALTDTGAIQDVFGAAANTRKTKKACGGRMLTKKRK